MKTIDEMCKVMLAFKDVKKIECRSDELGDWYDVKNPLWNWADKDYRVKPEPHYVPYDSVMEVERDKWVRKNDDDGREMLAQIKAFNLSENSVYVTWFGWYAMTNFFEEFAYEDGRPCGKLVEE